MHESTRRLYDAVSVLTGGNRTELGDVAAYVGVTSQVLKNWESRGVSKEGRLAIYAARGIDPGWLATGNGAMVVGAATVVEGQPAGSQPRQIRYAVGTIPEVMAFAEKIEDLPVTQRKYLAMLLTDLVMQPEKAGEIAPEIERLLHGKQMGKPSQPPFTTSQNGSTG